MSMSDGWKKGLLAAGWNLRKAVELATQVEEMGTQTYGALSRRWDSNESLRGLFARLAGEEKEHGQELHALLARIDAERSKAELDVESLRAIARTSFFSGEGGALGGLEELSSPRQVLEAVLKFEKGTWLYYRGLRDVLGPSAVLDLLVDEELRHTAEVTRELEDAYRRDPDWESGRAPGTDAAPS